MAVPGLVLTQLDQLERNPTVMAINNVSGTIALLAGSWADRVERFERLGFAIPEDETWTNLVDAANALAPYLNVPPPSSDPAVVEAWAAMQDQIARLVAYTRGSITPLTIGIGVAALVLAGGLIWYATRKR